MIRVKVGFEKNNFEGIVLSDLSSEELELFQNLTITMFKYYKEHSRQINRIEATELISQFEKVQQSIASKYKKKNAGYSDEYEIDDPLESLTLMANNLDLLSLFDELNEKFKKLYEIEPTYIFEIYEDEFETIFKTRIGTIFNLTKLV